jgi:DNA-3-methyladenine glycosylase
MERLTESFYNRDTLLVAKELLGCKICLKTPQGILGGIIVETEAYKQDDPACHAYRGKTKRAATLFKKPGLSYVYLIYGMYYCLNLVTEAEDTAGAALIRALEPLEPLKNTNGPGKLCRELKITKDHNEIDTTLTDSKLWVEKLQNIDSENIIETTRIGIKQAAEYPWRFYIKDNPHISKC